MWTAILLIRFYSLAIEQFYMEKMDIFGTIRYKFYGEQSSEIFFWGNFSTVI